MPRRVLFTILAFVLSILCLAAPAYAESNPPQGSIAGVVTSVTTRQPIPGVSVSASIWRNGQYYWHQSAKTDAAGRYVLPTLTEAEYKVCFSHADYVAECYDDWPAGGDATRVKVGPDAAATGIDAALVRLGGIRGRVVAGATGEGLPDATVALYGWMYGRWQELRTGVTDAEGRFAFGALDAGAYRLRFSADGYPTRFYKAGRTVTDALDVTLATGQAVQEVEMPLLRFGRIAGRVSNAAGEPLAGITVKVDDYWYPAGSAQTDALGRYEIGGLEEGGHRVYFEDTTHAFAPLNQVVTVHLGATATADQVLAATGSLHATLIDFYTGQPIPGIVVSVFLNPYDEFDATSDANGQVTVARLDPGEHQAAIYDPTGFYELLFSADIGLVVIRSGEVTEKQWVLKGGPRIVRGRITDAVTGAALGGISVNLLGSECHWRTGCHDYNMASVLTDAEGRFEYVNPAQDAIGLEATDPKGVYDDAGVHYRYPERGETVTADASLHTIASRYGDFAGRVTDANGAPLDGVTVTASRQDATGQLSGRTGADGTYRLRAPAGAYKLTFGGKAGFYDATYTDPRTGEGEARVWVAAGEVTAAAAALRSWGGIEGTVRTETGQPLSGVEVWVYEPCGASWCIDVPHLTTGADGRYRYTLPDGVYRVNFEAWGRETLVWGGAVKIEEGADITVANGNYETISATLRAGGVLTGQVLDRDSGLPVAGIRVLVNQWPITDADGRFVADGLRSGAYTVRLEDMQGRYPRQYYDDGGRTVQITAGMTTTIAITLQPPGRAAGRVTDPAGNPLAGIEVKVQQLCCYEWKAVTDANGQYQSPPLMNTDYYANDDYTVVFSDPRRHYQSEYAQATRIMPGQVVTLDATLDRLPSLSGAVTDASGAPIGDIHVYVPGKWAPLKEGYTDATGAYRLDDLPAWPTQLVFDACCRRYLPVTRSITLTVNTDTAGFDAQLQPWGELRGRVTDEATGAPIAQAWVKLYRRGAGPWTMTTVTVTAVDGTYAFYGLDSGTHRLEFADPKGRYVSEAYPDAPNVAAGGDVAFVREGDTEIDAALMRRVAEMRVYLPVVIQP